MKIKSFSIILALLLLCPMLFAQAAPAAKAVTIEAPLFEGGAGKDWFLYSARAFELQGDWAVNITSPGGQVAGTLKIKLISGPAVGKYAHADLTGTLQIQTSDPALQAINGAAGAVVRDLTNRESWSWRWSPGDREDVLAKISCNGAELKGSITFASAGKYEISGTKAKPTVVDMYLDPRIDDKIRVRFLEGTFPEITNGVNINYWPLIREGDILPLNEFLDQPNWEGDAKWRDSFLPGTLDEFGDNGQAYGIPVAEYAFVIWYNKKLFREHKWETPTTWDELLALCEKVKATGMSPMAFQGRYPYYAEPLYFAAYYQLGGPAKFKALDRGIPGAFSAPESVESIALVRRLAKDFFQPGAMGMSHTESQLQFFLGNTAMIPCGSWLKSEMLGKIPDGFELGCFNLPIVKNPKGDPTALQVHVEPFFVSKKAPHARESVELLRFMTSRRMAGRFARMQDIPTAIKGANDGNLSKDLEELNKIVAKAGISYGAVPGRDYPEMKQTYNDEMYDVIAAYDKSPQQIADHMESKSAEARNRAEHPDEIIVRHSTAPFVLLSLLAAGLLFYLYQLSRQIKEQALHPVKSSGLQKMSFRNVLLFVGPSILVYTLFVILPSIRSFAWSLHEWNGLTDMHTMPYKGLLNFKRLLFESDEFWIALKNNLFLMIVVPLFVIPLALFLAASISRQLIGSKFFRVVFFFPNLIGGVAATLLWMHLYNPQGGLINTALSAIGLSSFTHYAWLEPKNLNWSLIPISIWGSCGFNMVLFLAAMESIPESYYEAATIDGASRWRQFWTITVPLIWEVLAIAVVFLVIGGMKAFEIIWLLTNQQPSTTNHVVATRMVQAMFAEFKVGESAALAVLLFLMVFVSTAATLRGMKREAIEM